MFCVNRRVTDDSFPGAARAYYMSSFTKHDNLARAEATLNELMNLMSVNEQNENEASSTVRKVKFSWHFLPTTGLGVL